ncbi:MAG: PEGA domain-containing protein [Myxococcota bacterium]
MPHLRGEEGRSEGVAKPSLRLLVSALLVSALLLTSVGAAQPVLRTANGDPLWVQELQARGAASLDTIPPAPAFTPRARMDAFRRASDLLTRARGAAGQLQEDEALALLSRARDELQAHADVPGTSRWLAEVETAIGIVASHAGLAALGDSALNRAASLDPTRDLHRGEATPTVVARARALAAAQAVAPEGRFEVRVNAANAEVWLDDRLVGNAPLEVRAPVGRHVLRVQAPGHRSWGRVFDLFAGDRAPIVVVLSPTERQSALRALGRAGSLREAAGLAAQIGRPLWWLQPGRGDRALLYSCDQGRCSVPVRVERSVWREPGAPTSWRVVEQATRGARRWAERERVTTTPGARPLWRRWQLWVPIALAAALLATGLGVWLRPEPEQRLQLQVDFGDLEPE